MAKMTLPNGAIVDMTVTELVEYQQKLGTVKKTGRSKSATVENPPSNMSPWEAFSGYVSGTTNGKLRQRKVLAIIKGRGDVGIDIHELCKLLEDRDANVTSGTIAGITRNAKKAGYDDREVIFKDHDGRYRAGPILIENETPVP